MQSIKQQITILMVAAIVILGVSFMVAIGLQVKETAVLAAVTKAKTDLQSAEAIVDLKYPGPWKVEGGVLYKGETKINNNNAIVDYISQITGNSSTIFMGNTRVVTTVKKEDGERAIGTHASDEVVKTVLNQGKEYLGEAEVVGQIYQTAYKPLYDEKGNIVGMFYVGISKSYFNQLFYDTLKSLAIIGALITGLVFLGTMYFTKRVITEPLRQLTEETQKFAQGDFCSLYSPTQIQSQNEIGELARAINQMGVWVQTLTHKIDTATHLAGAQLVQQSQAIGSTEQKEVITEREDCLKKITNGDDTEQWGELVKGLNEITLQQILGYLKDKEESLSASDIASEVNLTKVTVRRYLDFMEKCGRVRVDMQYGPVGRPLKLYKLER